MTASEVQSLETHSEATVCSGLYAKSTPKWNTKMHASKLLKGVLISRTLNATSSDQESSSAASPNCAPARGKRAFSSDNALISGNLIPKKTASPIKTTCLCAPTKHAGSFRCRLHRVTQKHWDGRQIHPTSTSTAAASSSASRVPANENFGSVGVISPWANGVAVPTTGCMSRTGASRPSRLRMVVVAAQAEETGAPDIDDPVSPMLSEGSLKYIKVATSTTITEDVTVKDCTRAALVSRKLHSSS